MCSIIKLLSGDGERDLMQEDTSFTAPSRTTYVAQHLVFAAVMADAAMVDDALASALHRASPGGVGRGAEHFFLSEAWPAFGRLFLCSWHSSWDCGRVSSVVGQRL